MEEGRERGGEIELSEERGGGEPRAREGGGERRPVPPPAPVNESALTGSRLRSCPAFAHWPYSNPSPRPRDSQLTWESILLTIKFILYYDFVTSPGLTRESRPRCSRDLASPSFADRIRTHASRERQVSVAVLPLLS